jgi:methylase of polypeptide subunit release factors
MKWVRPLIEQSPRWLRPGGRIVVEIAAATKQAALQVVERTAGLTEGKVLADHQALPRMLVATAG